MKILFIVPGSGDTFYCGNCFRDNLQASALRKAGHEVVVMPVYLPLEQPSFRADAPLFFPAVTFYTAHKFFGKRQMPGWLERITGSKAALKMAASMSGSTSAKGTEAMTLSMVDGGDAAFDRHVGQLISWVETQEKPDIVHLSSILLIAIGGILKQRLRIPVVCSVQDEDIWIDGLAGHYPDSVRQAIARNACHIDRFTATSEFYKNKIRETIPQIDKIEVIYPGVDRDRYASRSYPDDPTIGFFYRMNKANGLDTLAEAFVKLKQRNAVSNLKLRIGGGYTSHDERFLKKIKKTLAPYQSSVAICEDYTPEDHAAFYASVSLVSVPITFDESVGLYLCEAFAAGRPAVEPATGSFPEIVGEAGVLYQPNNSAALAAALEKLLTDKTLYASAVAKATELSATRYNDGTLARQLIGLYSDFVSISKPL